MKFKEYLLAFFTGAAAILAFLFLKPRRKGLSNEDANEAIDKLEEIKNRESVDEKFLGQSDADIILSYIKQQELKRRKDSESK